MTKIIIDCLGGDNSPKAHITASIKALNTYDDLSIILVGDEKEIRDELKDKSYDKKRLEIVHAPDIITGDDKPTDAIRMKKDSSMMTSIKLLRTDDSIDALISTGATGALVAAATVRIPRLRHVIRPAFCPLLPTMDGHIVGICDTGASVDIDADYLKQYAIMSSIYMENVYNVKSPRIALLNIGTEEHKGDELRQKAYPLLKNTKSINFVGNMESRDLLSGKYDVVVADGFSGNVLVKTVEGTALELLKKLKKDIKSKLINKIGALFLYKTLMEEKEFMNYQNYGGSVLLGTSKVIIKGHGSSDETALYACIKQAYKMQTSNMNQKIEETLEKEGEE